MQAKLDQMANIRRTNTPKVVPPAPLLESAQTTPESLQHHSPTPTHDKNA